MRAVKTTTAHLLGLLLLAAALPDPARALKPKARPAPAATPAKPPAATAPAKPPETLSYGRFGQVAIYRPSPHPKNVVLFLSGDGGWRLSVAVMARNLSMIRSRVAGINVPQL